MKGIAILLLVLATTVSSAVHREPKQTTTETFWFNVQSSPLRSNFLTTIGF